MKNYAERFKNPKWQEMRLKIMERDSFKCQKCFDEDGRTLHVHHKYYEWGKDPWEYPTNALITLCDSCHEEETEEIKDACSMLVIAARTRLFAGNIAYLAEIIENISLPAVQDVVLSAMKRTYTDEKRCRKECDRLINDALKSMSGGKK